MVMDLTNGAKLLALMGPMFYTSISQEKIGDQRPAAVQLPQLFYPRLPGKNRKDTDRIPYEEKRIIIPAL